MCAFPCAPSDGTLPCVIIYCLKRSTTAALAQSLSSKGVACASYHASLPPAVRQSVLEQWQSGQVPVVAATIAFGMGVDKAGELDSRSDALVCHSRECSCLLFHRGTAVLRCEGKSCLTYMLCSGACNGFAANLPSPGLFRDF